MRHLCLSLNVLKKDVPSIKFATIMSVIIMAAQCSQKAIRHTISMA